MNNFSIGPGLIAHWLSCFKTFTSIIFYYVGQMPSDVKWRKKEKRNHKEHHKKASFFHIAEFSNGFFFCFIFEKTYSSLPMLFVHIGKSSSETLRSSGSQMFFKIFVLKNFSMFAKSTYVRVSF